MKVKTFKTLDEQIEILVNKGLVINDYDFARSTLLRENYFFINGYRHLFLNSTVTKNFMNGTKFEEIFSLFYFDRQLRNILFKNILIFENNLKSVISYIISKNHGFKETCYLNPKMFTRDPMRYKQTNDLLKKMKRQIRVNGKQHSATMHYINNYDYLPIWIAVKVLSFGIVGELYLVLQNQDKAEIADVFTTDVDNLMLYLPILANYRNLCAHEDICYENKTQKSIYDTKYHHDLYIPKVDGEYVCGKNDLFSLIIILKEVLCENDFGNMMGEINYELERLSSRLSTIGINRVTERMGFPYNYREIVRMD